MRQRFALLQVVAVVLLFIGARIYAPIIGMEFFQCFLSFNYWITCICFFIALGLWSWSDRISRK